MNNNVPVKHRKVAHAWVEGHTILGRKVDASFIPWRQWHAVPYVSWREDWEYKVLPTKILTYVWLVYSKHRDQWGTTSGHYPTAAAASVELFSDFKVHSKVEESVREVEVEYEEGEKND